MSKQGKKRPLTREEIVSLRDKHMCKAQKLSYVDPLMIVRGKAQYLYDETGRAYLDMQNNVAHVGHCHPRLTEAVNKQMQELYTNTRYYHENIVLLAQSLANTMPGDLEVCFFVNSGTEANDLALRLARTYTGAHDVVTMETGYHGSTTAVLEISPYKFDGKGGFPIKEHVKKVPIPDTYKGEFGADDKDAGSKYAEYVKKRIDDAEKEGRKVAAYICESIMGCAGQVVLPDGFMKTAFEHARNAGAVCIADEVQCGFGRVGSHMWAFETQDCVPDIVTLGKPMGNGFPLACVVTTRKIADAFHNGMEYFNTFGGNPVSCCVGQTVLDIIADEKLQSNAKTVGDYMMTRLQELKQKHDLIGDVRGLGLFIGVELVKDRTSKVAAESECKEVIERLKNGGILVGVDGPQNNVVKIKPPMCVTKVDINYFVDAFDEILSNLDKPRDATRYYVQQDLPDWATDSKKGGCRPS